MRLIWYVNCLKYLIEYDLMWKLDFIIQIIERIVFANISTKLFIYSNLYYIILWKKLKILFLTSWILKKLQL